MFGKNLSLAFAMSMCFCTAVFAETVEEKGRRAQELLEAGRHLEAAQVLEEASVLVWDASPLIVKNAQFVSSVTGYGVFAPVENGAVFSEGDKMTIYLEAFGQKHAPTGLGVGYRIESEFDLFVTNSQGEQVFSYKGLDLDIIMRYKHRKVFYQLHLTLKELTTDAYTVEVVAKDKHSDKSATFSLPFEWVE